MKFGICASIDNIAKLNPGTVDYVELSLSNIQKMTAEELKATADRLASIGVPTEAANGFFPPEVRLCGKEYRPENVSEYTKRAMDNADYLGIHTCVLGSSFARNIPEGEDRDTCLCQFEEAVVIAGDIAKEHGTVVVLEPLCVKEANYLNKVSEGAEICRRLAHPAVFLLADYYHVMDAKEPMSVYTENADLLRHLHIADPAIRSFPRPTDGHDYAPLAAAVKAAKYDLRMSIEGGAPEPFAERGHEAIAYLRKLFA